MQQDRHKRLYDLHSWIGILLGLFIYLVAFSGTAAVFNDELKAWEDPTLRLALPEQQTLVDARFRQFASEQADKGETVFLRLEYPRTELPHFDAYARIKTEDGVFVDNVEKWHPETLETLKARDEGLTEWLLDFHRNLMLPRTLGRTIVGIAGILMLVLSVTGILIHGRIIRDFFTLRLARSTRLKWQDSHKVIGIFGLPFFLMISFTGAFLGVVAILAPITAFIAFQGDTEALLEKVLGEQLEAVGEPATMLSVDDAYAIKHPTTGEDPRQVFIQNYGDKNASYLLTYEATDGLNRFDQIEYSGVTGLPLNAGRDTTDLTAADQVIAAMSPLHYATFGGVWLKRLYIGLGLTLCILTATGLMIWIERRLYGTEGNRSKRYYEALSRLNIGVCMGFPIATAALFYHDKLYTGIESDRLYWSGVTYFAAAIGVTIFALCQRDGYKCMKKLLNSLGAMCLAIPILNGLTTGAKFWISETIGQIYSNNFDISIFIVGVLIIIAATQIPVSRNAKDIKRQVTMKTTEPLAAE